MIAFIFLLCCLCNASLLQLRAKIVDPQQGVLEAKAEVSPDSLPRSILLDSSAAGASSLLPGCEGEGQPCGGAASLSCLEGAICVDNPNDNCNPKLGGSDCIGICKCDCSAVQCPSIACHLSPWESYTPAGECCPKCKMCSNGETPLYRDCSQPAYPCPGGMGCQGTVCCNCVGGCAKPDCPPERQYMAQNECCPVCAPAVCPDGTPRGAAPVVDINCKISKCPAGSSCVGILWSYGVCCKN